MKTEQEQIEKMARAMCGFCVVEKRCALNCCAPCSDVASQDCSYKENAEMLISAGYGEVSEYKAEIERLKDEIIYLERKIAIRDNALKDRDKAIEMLEGKQDTIVKQAKIDVLNKLKDIVFDYLGVKNIKEAEALSLLDSTLTYDVITCGIDEIIKEVQNAEDKS